MSYICKEPGKDIQGEPVDDGHGNYKGECVSLVKLMCPSIPATSAWKKGKAVKDLKVLATNTAIATFDKSGKYHGHAAIYTGQTDKGIWVWDQYNRPPKGVSHRLISFKTKNDVNDVNDANNYFVIE